MTVDELYEVEVLGTYSYLVYYLVPFGTAFLVKDSNDLKNIPNITNITSNWVTSNLA